MNRAQRREHDRGVRRHRHRVVVKPYGPVCLECDIDLAPDTQPTHTLQLGTPPK